MISCLSAVEVDRLIAEDVPYGDLTTQALAIGEARGRVVFSARAAMRVCGLEEAKLIFEHLGTEAVVRMGSGVAVEAGVELLETRGTAEALLAGWKIAQTLVEWSSGVASATAQLVNAARHAAPGIVVACTRKTVPFSRRLAVKSVLAGGGAMHRTDLSQTLLLFPEHRLFLQEECVASLVRLRVAAPERSVVVEVSSVEEALRTAEHADVVQLEKFSPEEAARVVDGVRRCKKGRPVIAAAGGIHPGNAAHYAAAGVDVLVSSWPYYTGPCDVDVRFATE